MTQPEPLDPQLILQRNAVQPTLVYWHCGVWWPLEDGAGCLMDHDEGPRRGRRRRAWLCDEGEGGICYLSRKDFLEHDEGACYAN